MPSSSKYWSIQSARYPLSPPSAKGQAIRSPSSSSEAGVGGDEQFVEHRRFVRLASREMEVQRQTVAVAEDVDFRRKAPAGAA